MWQDYRYDYKRPEGTEEDLDKDVGEPQQRVRNVTSGTWHVVVVGLRLELFGLISSRLHIQMSVLVTKQCAMGFTDLD